MEANTVASGTSLVSLGVPRIAFLGVCERAALVRTGHPVTWHHNLIGLRHSVLNYFYPCSAQAWHLVLACYDPSTLGTAYLRLVDESDAEIFTATVTFEHRTAEPDGSFTEQRSWTPMPPGAQSWYLLHQQLDGVVIPRPGTIRVLLRTNDATTEACVGTLACVLVNPPPLTPDRIAAIRA